MGVYISVNTLCDMGATCCNVLGDLACSVAMKETVKLDATPTADQTADQPAAAE
jgi:Na+/H+-dicarboxylate symporter